MNVNSLGEQQRTGDYPNRSADLPSTISAPAPHHYQRGRQVHPEWTLINFSQEPTIVAAAAAAATRIPTPDAALDGDSPASALLHPQPQHQHLLRQTCTQFPGPGPGLPPHFRIPLLKSNWPHWTICNAQQVRCPASFDNLSPCGDPCN